ncbi:hypothetical protein ARMSODRAFT_1006609 [Armillaria solidipes]|uniref:Uncharacterized protein n=1 Tax=Armillaria solidipes TaxID=1076256 RepID=A0A2H3B3R5_9AGAR|nr:hypothetical protein ARMSODRAFT_1006609 [Armillaria solidipes]
MLAGTVLHGDHEGAYKNLPHFDGNKTSLRLLSSATLDMVVRSRTSSPLAGSPTKGIASQQQSRARKKTLIEFRPGQPFAFGPRPDTAIYARPCTPLHAERTEFAKFQQVERRRSHNCDVNELRNSCQHGGTRRGSLARILPPLRPSEAINLLEDDIREVTDMYNEHKNTLGDCASFETDFNRLELAALELKGKYFQDSLLGKSSFASVLWEVCVGSSASAPSRG